jgi:colicin import membrane protein
MSERQAKAFLAHRAGQDVCVSYDVDGSGRLLFALELAPTRTRLPLAVGFAVAVAACSPKPHQPSEQEQAAALASASAAAHASAAAECAADRAQEEALAQRLAEAKDEATRARLEAELSAARADHRRHEGAVGEVRQVAGKMARPPVRRGACTCPPGDPLCSCR